MSPDELIRVLIRFRDITAKVKGVKTFACTQLLFNYALLYIDQIIK